LVRPARPDDNAALLDLVEACPMRASFSLRTSRRPDFFALTRLSGEWGRVLVIQTAAGTLAGCIAVHGRRCWIGGQLRPSLYIGDLRVHPAWRRQGLRDALVSAASRLAAEIDPDMPGLVTVLAGNRAVRSLLAGKGGTAPLLRFATVRLHTLPLIRRRKPPSSLRITAAGPQDASEMAALWSRLAPRRQFTQARDEVTLSEWVAAAPGLGWPSYWLARRPDGSLAGFLAVWDERGCKETTVLEYSSGAAAFRAMYNAVAPALGGAPLPRRGETLRALQVVHLCVAPEEPDTLRALLLAAAEGGRGLGAVALTIGLDVSDPAVRALAGIPAITTDVEAYVLTAGGPWRGAPLDDRPLHFEIALA
jgi:GNAT superfamily N-acetyltransferase